MNTDTILTSLTSDRASNAGALSEMIQISAKAEAIFVPMGYPCEVCVSFKSEKAARAFQDAFESFAHASKRTVKRVRAKERAEMAMKRPGKTTS